MLKLDKKIAVWASGLGALTIGLGAFAAHGLEGKVTADAILSFQTGVRYQMYHVILLLVVGIVPALSGTTKKWLFRIFVLGMLLFSGSIYLLVLKDYLPFSVGFIGPITPLGGLLLIFGWLRMGYAFLTLKKADFKSN